MWERHPAAMIRMGGARQNLKSQIPNIYVGAASCRDDRDGTATGKSQIPNSKSQTFMWERHPAAMIVTAYGSVGVWE